MSRSQARPGCFDLAFQEAYALGDAAEVALEDYARALLHCQSAETMPAGDSPARTAGVHVCGLAAPASRAALADLEAFAREMAAPGGDGLGWS